MVFIDIVSWSPYFYMPLFLSVPKTGLMTGLFILLIYEVLSASATVLRIYGDEVLDCVCFFGAEEAV